VAEKKGFQIRPTGKYQLAGELFAILMPMKGKILKNKVALIKEFKLINILFICSKYS